MGDGSPSLPVSSKPTILEDTAILSSLSISLTNPQDPTSSENISLSPSSLPAGIALSRADGWAVELSGEASADSYAAVLSTVVYSYSRMEGILENEPDFTPRYRHQLMKMARGGKERGR